MGKPLPTPTFALDEELWFGEGTDVEAESRAAASLAAVGARIVGAKPFPIAARRLDELTRTTNTRIEQVVSVLESDPALSARLLRLVNSAGYGLKLRCTSVRHAAVLVGTRRLNQVATTAAILDLFDNNNQRAVELLEHAAVVGSLCRYLAVHVGLPHDELFTCGFLHDIGKLMLLDAERERYAEVLADFGGAPDQMHLEERRVFGFDHAVLGAHVLAAWNIPEPVPKVIAWHHAPARAMQDTVISSMVQTLRLADLLAYVLALHDEKVGIEIVAASEAARYLDISDAQLSAMWADLAGLRERSRARSHGEPELDAIVPKSELPDPAGPRSPRTSRTSIASASSRAARPLQEVPVHFPCNVCGKPSYGNVCPACGGHVCPDHQGTTDEWCATCRREFTHFKKTEPLPLYIKVPVGALVGGTLAFGVIGALRDPNGGALALVTAPLVVIALWAVVLPVAYKLWQKLAFLQNRRVAAPAVSAPASSRVNTSIVPELPADGMDIAEAPVSENAPALSIGPISTASLALSVAPPSSSAMSSPPLSMSPPLARSAEAPSSGRGAPKSRRVRATPQTLGQPAPSQTPSTAPIPASLAPTLLASAIPGGAESVAPVVRKVPSEPSLSMGPILVTSTAPEALVSMPPAQPAEPPTPATSGFPQAVASFAPASNLTLPAPSILPDSVPAAPAPTVERSEPRAPSLVAVPEPPLDQELAEETPIPSARSSLRLTPSAAEEERVSESGPHAVLSLRPAPPPPLNTAVSPAHLVRCSNTVLNSCSVTVVVADPMSPAAQKSASGL